jgi:hypothetical protein
MANDKHIPLEELAAQIEQAVRDMQSGNISKEDVERLHIQSRDLHERLTVLRFKAFEAIVQSDDNSENLDLNPENKSQTNLIDSIAEATASDVPKESMGDPREKSLAESLQSLPLSSIGEGLTILDRANFTSTLFSNDATSFNDMLDSIDACSNFDSALGVFNNSIRTDGTEPEIESVVKAFEVRITRRFPS